MLWGSPGGATNRIEKQIYCVAIKFFLCHLHSNRHVYAERLVGVGGENKVRERRGWVGLGWVGFGGGDRRLRVILSHTTFLRQNGVACTRPKK